MVHRYLLEAKELLLVLIGALALASSAVGCLAGGAFEGLRWLWALPLGFVGGFLGWLVLAFLFLWAVCAVVDQNKPQEKDSRFYRAVAGLYIDALVRLLGVRVHATGLEMLPKEGRFLLVCNHQHMADPAILLHCFRRSQLAFISKQENRDMFLVGKVMHKLQCQTLDRDNDRSALKTILNCIRILKEDRASIAVFPEGYTSKDCKLRHFRPGVFKIAQKAKVPIVVCTIRNTRQILKNAPKLRSTDIELHLVAVVPPEELEGKTTVQISDEVHALMAADLGPDFVAEE